MTEHNVGTRDEWLAARKQLLDQVPNGRRYDFRVHRHDEYPDAGL